MSAYIEAINNQLQAIGYKTAKEYSRVDILDDNYKRLGSVMMFKERVHCSNKFTESIVNMILSGLE